MAKDKKPTKETKSLKKYQIFIDWSSDYPILTERDLREMFEGTGVILNSDSLEFHSNRPFQYKVLAKATDEIRKAAINQIRGIKFVEIVPREKDSLS